MWSVSSLRRRHLSGRSRDVAQNRCLVAHHPGRRDQRLAGCGARSDRRRDAGPPLSTVSTSPDVGGPAVSLLPPLPITSEEVRPHIEYLASAEMQGRSGRAAARAAAYIQGQFEAAGLQPLFPDGGYLQLLPGSERDDGEADIVGQNVGGWIPGSDPELRDEYVIISAHYDHLGVREGETYFGADDNASGVSMLLETAREFAALEQKPRRSLVFVAFDLEERLLWGSRWFAAHPPWELERVKLFITADMIGRSLGDLPLPTVFVLGSEHAPLLKEVLNEVAVPEGLEVARLGIDLIGTRSDYGPFRDRRVPFLFFSTGEHPDYHTPFDRPARIDYPKVARISSLILGVATDVANRQTPPEWTDTVSFDLTEARSVHRITELMLSPEAQSDAQLNSIQRFFVTQVHHRTGNVIRLGRITPPERQWLVRSVQLLMLSVF